MNDVIISILLILFGLIVGIVIMFIINVIKKNSASNKADNLQYKSGMACGEFYVCMGYNSDVLQIMDENENLIEVANHPKMIVKFNVPFKLSKYDMMRIKVFDISNFL